MDPRIRASIPWPQSLLRAWHLQGTRQRTQVEVLTLVPAQFTIKLKEPIPEQVLTLGDHSPLSPNPVLRLSECNLASVPHQDSTQNPLQ